MPITPWTSSALTPCFRASFLTRPPRLAPAWRYADSTFPAHTTEDDLLCHAHLLRPTGA
jgi:hypothetical protein